MSWAALLLAAALMLGADSRPLMRARAAPVSPRRRAAQIVDDPLATASSFDVFAACLRSGMAVSTAASATAASAPAPLARLLNRAADLLALGAEPAAAWTGADSRGADALMRLARRSASSGTALAQGVAELADQSRHQASAAANAAAERASVLIAGPLGLCYLPAFVCLGIVPVVAGLAGDVLRSGIV
ncbi:type II secretion system F family protein [Mycobacterium sp. 3519A]|jgi:pilus assembly protein TadC|uniref:type II secretion system F family protein n=1 Tax=Mycobacterium sp. 3519A TaxID=2057184 RepID=UPI000C7BD14F|nr:type II secretion system F family protein [Mycobacterium sp. 3519A]